MLPTFIETTFGLVYTITNNLRTPVLLGVAKLSYDQLVDAHNVGQVK